jgi:hypothetical protein
MRPQAARMSCYSVAEEITSICADFLVVNAVLENQSQGAYSLLTGKRTGKFSISDRSLQNRP